MYLLKNIIQLFIGGLFMWVITIINSYSKENNVTMLEFETEVEARTTYEKLQQRKIFSEVIYCYSPSINYC